jgi:hypothetical protein
VPNQPDRTRLGGGLAIPSPFGTFYAPNISPDANDGIGRWTEAEFVTAVTRGTAPDGTHYFPAFPYTSYQHAGLEDVRDLFAYLKILPAIAGKVRDHDLPFPFNIRRNVGIWKWLFMDGKPYTADASQSAAWNRGEMERAVATTRIGLRRAPGLREIVLQGLRKARERGAVFGNAPVQGLLEQRLAERMDRIDIEAGLREVGHQGFDRGQRIETHRMRNLMRTARIVREHECHACWAS